MSIKLDLSEDAALVQLLRDAVCSSALKKFFQIQEQDCKESAVSTENQVPGTLDEEMRKRTLVAQYAAHAKVWGDIWTEIESYVGNIEPTE